MLKLRLGKAPSAKGLPEKLEDLTLILKHPCNEPDIVVYISFSKKVETD